MTLTFSGLIRAHGSEGGQTTTYDPDETTVPVTNDTTDSGGTTTWDPNATTFDTTGSEDTTWDPDASTLETTWNPDVSTYATTAEETTVVTTAPSAVIGSVDSGGSVRFFSSYWWYKAKMYSSSPNPSGSVTMYVQPAGAEKGSGGIIPPEQAGPIVSITGFVDENGVFDSTSSGSVGSTFVAEIGHLPGSTSVVECCITIESIDKLSNQIKMKGKVWARASTGGALAQTDKPGWEVSVTLVEENP